MFGWFRKKKPPEKPGEVQRNDKVRAALSAHGDDGTRVRHVIHFAYPVEDAAQNQQAARDIVGWTGCEFTETEDSSGIVFEHYREVASEDFDALTGRLGRELAAIGWTYDGWECAVETGE